MAPYGQIIRSFSTTSCLQEGKRNFRKFLLYNKRGTRQFKEKQATDPDPDIPIDTRGVRETGVKINGKFKQIPEMVPELIVPDLTDFYLKPYVSYTSTDVIQSEFTAKDLFDFVYADKIKKDYQENKLTSEGEPLEPSTNEKLTAQEAADLASKTGSDIFVANHVHVSKFCGRPKKE